MIMHPQVDQLGEARMVDQERWAEIRRLFDEERVSISEIGRRLDVDRKTVRRSLRQVVWRPYHRAVVAETLLTAHADFVRDRAPLTLLFERLATDVLGQCSVTGATKILRISWDKAWGIMERAVTRGRQRKAPKMARRIGGDEKAAAKGHKYLTLVCDLDEGTVEHIAEDRRQESLEATTRG